MTERGRKERKREKERRGGGREREKCINYLRRGKEIRIGQGMVVNAFNLSTQGAVKWISEFQASLVYIFKFWEAKAT